MKMKIWRRAALRASITTMTVVGKKTGLGENGRFLSVDPERNTRA